jgi:hypothetical protein
MGLFSGDESAVFLGLNTIGIVVMVILLICSLLFLGLWLSVPKCANKAIGKAARAIKPLDSINSENMNQIEHMSDQDKNSSVDDTDKNKEQM